MSKSFTIDCSAVLADNFFTLQEFVEYLQPRVKVAHLRNNLANKLTIVKNESDKTIQFDASVPYSKRACRYYARKFLKKQGLRERFRVIATSKTSYEFRPYRVSSNE
jgi:large subunit ribosomal protein L22e